MRLPFSLRFVMALLISVLGAMAQSPVAVKKLAPIAEGVDSLPRLSGHSLTIGRINTALAAQDRLVRRNWEACHGLDGDQHEMYLKRSIQITMSGGALLGLFIAVQAQCGGVHPFMDDFTLTYDLRTGALVDWAALFPPGTVQKEQVKFDVGPTLIALRSPQLEALYRKGWKDRDQCRLEDVIDEGGTDDFLLYPDADAGAVQIFPTDLINVERICAYPVALDRTALTSLGISEEWQKTLLGY